MQRIYLTLLFCLGSNLALAAPPELGRSTSFKQLESKAYVEVEQRIEETFQGKDNFTFQELNASLIRAGLRVHQQELRYLREAVLRTRGEKPNTFREAIDFNLDFLRNEKLTLENIEFEIKRFEEFLEYKTKQIEALKYGSDLWSWRVTERSWLSKMLGIAKDAKRNLEHYNERIDRAKAVINEVQLLPADRSRPARARESCSFLGFATP